MAALTRISGPTMVDDEITSPVTSESTRSQPEKLSLPRETWVQLPASYLLFFTEYGEVVDGVYVRTPSRESEQELFDELAAWEAASDEDLWAFEQGLE
jgi:hypothetical protein